MYNGKISVVVSTYNNANILSLVLSCLCEQDDGLFEIIVADDGSVDSTVRIINEIRGKFCQIPIFHVWQPKHGFRLARIRNLAVKRASGDYLIFLDGDCIPPPNFLTQHRHLAEEGWHVVGQRILLSKEYSESLIKNKSCLSNRKFWTFFNFMYRYIKGDFNRLFPFFNIKGNEWRKRKFRSFDKVRGCNWGMWKSDYINVNGSDELFIGWGSEDQDLAIRLLNLGIFIKDGRNKSLVLHLWHEIADRSYSDKNRNLAEERLVTGLIKAEKGMF